MNKSNRISVIAHYISTINGAANKHFPELARKHTAQRCSVH